MAFDLGGVLTAFQQNHRKHLPLEGNAHALEAVLTATQAFGPSHVKVLSKVTEGGKMWEKLVVRSTSHYAELSSTANSCKFPRSLLQR